MERRRSASRPIHRLRSIRASALPSVGQAGYNPRCSVRLRVPRGHVLQLSVGKGDDKMRFAVILLTAAGVASELQAAEPGNGPIAFDPLDCRWTFGNHEPISMYRRAGNRVTGGIEGSALWLEDWHRWYDSQASVQLMQELGLNMLHSRFYKGLGWQHESRDFPNVQRFVENCHRHGIRVLAYVQFSTLYYETMLAEIPDLAEWAAVDEDGRKRTYHTAYYRWLPCINAPGFEPYLKKMISIALNQGGFDGIMFDNCHVPACYCSRCAALFREYLAREPEPEQRFGIPTADHVVPPVRRPEYGEIQDPIYQQWIRFRCERVTALYSRLYRHAKSCRPTAIVSGNIQNIRRANMAGSAALNMADMSACFDIFVSQSGNVPGLAGGCLVNRVREMKLAQALQTPILALCDSDAGVSPEAESGYVRTLVEDAVFGGIPTDRTVMKPDPKMVSSELVAFRRPLLQRFNETVLSGREGLAAPSYVPLRILYSHESIMFSEQAHRAVLSAEEILLRNHVPYGLLATQAVEPLEIPADCELLLVPDQRCLADEQLDALLRFAERGGRLVVTGQSGAYDHWYRQRRDNPLQVLDARAGVIRRNHVDTVPIQSSGWTIRVQAPGEGGQRLLTDLAALWSPAIRIQAPATVLAEVKRNHQAFFVHLVNYAGETVAAGSRIEWSSRGFDVAGSTFAAPMENRPAAPIAVHAAAADRRAIELPAFADYAVVRIETKARSNAEASRRD